MKPNIVARIITRIKRRRARIDRGKKGVTEKEIQTARKNFLWLVKWETRRRGLEIFEREKDPKMEKIVERIRKGETVEGPSLQKAWASKKSLLARNLSSKYALDAIKEFNPKKRNQIKKQLEIIDNATKKQNYGVAQKESKEIFRLLGKTKAAKFFGYYDKTKRKLLEIIDELNDDALNRVIGTKF